MPEIIERLYSNRSNVKYFFKKKKKKRIVSARNLNDRREMGRADFAVRPTIYLTSNIFEYPLLHSLSTLQAHLQQQARRFHAHLPVGSSSNHVRVLSRWPVPSSRIVLAQHLLHKPSNSTHSFSIIIPLSSKVCGLKKKKESS